MSTFQTSLSFLINEIKDYSPLIAFALGSPMASTAIVLLEKAFGAKWGDINDLLQKVKDSDDKIEKLKLFEIEHTEFLTTSQNQAKNNAMTMEVNDRKSARDLDAQTRSNDRIMHAIAFLYIFGFFTYICCYSLNVIHKDDQIMSDLNTATGFIVAFYFGASYTKTSRR